MSNCKPIAATPAQSGEDARKIIAVFFSLAAGNVSQDEVKNFIVKANGQ